MKKKKTSFEDLLRMVDADNRCALAALIISGLSLLISVVMAILRTHRIV